MAIDNGRQSKTITVIGCVLALTISVAGIVSLVFFGRAYIESGRDITREISAEIERTADFSGVEDALIVLDGALNVSRGPGAFGSRGVSYTLAEPHPAASVIDEISVRLAATGWKPLDEDWLNPGMPSSHLTGWGDFVDATVKPIRQVHQWMAQWKDGSGNIVTYTFLYSYPENGKPDLSSLSVNGAWYPAAGVRWMTMR